MMMDIAEVARRTDIVPSALRYYEGRGLIASIGRRGLRRMFEPAVLKQLALIALGKRAGFSLDEIAALVAGSENGIFDREVLKAQADLLDEKIVTLTLVRDELRAAAACPASQHMNCPNFGRTLQAASAQAGRQS